MLLGVLYVQIMARRGRPPTGNDRDRVLPNIRVTADEERLLRWGAEQDDLPLSTWLRDLGLMRAAQIEEDQEPTHS